MSRVFFLRKSKCYDKGIPVISKLLHFLESKLKVVSYISFYDSLKCLDKHMNAFMLIMVACRIWSKSMDVFHLPIYYSSLSIFNYICSFLSHSCPPKQFGCMTIVTTCIVIRIPYVFFVNTPLKIIAHSGLGVVTYIYS